MRKPLLLSSPLQFDLSGGKVSHHAAVDRATRVNYDFDKLADWLSWGTVWYQEVNRGMLHDYFVASIVHFALPCLRDEHNPSRFIVKTIESPDLGGWHKQITAESRNDTLAVKGQFLLILPDRVIGPHTFSAICPRCGNQLKSWDDECRELEHRFRSAKEYLDYLETGLEPGESE